MRAHWRRLSATMFATIIALSFTSSAIAYELAPSAQFAYSEINDGVLTICYGESITEQLYTNRTLIAAYLKDTWGTDGFGEITFTSLAMCDNDGANIKLRWNRTWDCDDGDLLGNTPDGPTEWTHITVWVNAQCNIDGVWDWTCNNPLSSDANTTNDTQHCIHMTIAHEIGHALGIRHSSVSTALVENQFSWCDNGSSRGVARDDISGLRQEYNDFPLTLTTWWNSINPNNAPTTPMCWN